MAIKVTITYVNLKVSKNSEPSHRSLSSNESWVDIPLASKKQKSRYVDFYCYFWVSFSKKCLLLFNTILKTVKKLHLLQIMDPLSVVRVCGGNPVPIWRQTVIGHKLWVNKWWVTSSHLQPTSDQSEGEAQSGDQSEARWGPLGPDIEGRTMTEAWQY